MRWHHRYDKLPFEISLFTASKTKLWCFELDSVVDLRSDTVTKPSIGMRQAMLNADVGDDVYGEDPTAAALEEKAAELLKTESALFVTSGTQSNLLALLSHCQRGDEYIAGSQAHSYLEEGGGGAVLASIQPQPIENSHDGTIDLNKVEAAIKPDDFHYATTRLFCLENTFYGQPLPITYLEEAATLAQHHGLSLHLDGARLFNAAIKQNTPAHEISQHFDSISACLSKGLGAPMGSVLCGTRKFIQDARRWRKMLGGGWRQAGIVASAGLYALEHNIGRLVDDHENALLLSRLLEEIDGLAIDKPKERTNMVFVTVPEVIVPELTPRLRQAGILITCESNPVRLVTHLDIDKPAIYRSVEAFRHALSH